MKRKFLIIVLVFYFFSGFLYSQDKVTYELFLRFSEYYNSGDFLSGEKAMLSVVNSKNPNALYLVAAYNNLGIVNNHLGKYEESLKWYNLAESRISNKQNSKELADIYTNKATIYLIQKSFDTAIEYLDKAIAIYLTIDLADNNILQKTSTAYMNLGIVYCNTKDYKTAFKYLNKSLGLKAKNNLPEKALLCFNLAKTYSGLDNPLKAEELYLKSIADFKKEFGEEYYRLADVYFDFGSFLGSLNRNCEELTAYRKALFICQKNYGEKHTYTSLSYKHLGDFFIQRGNYDSALVYFQKSLISVVKDYNDKDIFSNPNIDSVIFNIRLLDNLKGKAMALELLAERQDSSGHKILTYQKSLETIDLALDLIDRIRIKYLTQESKIYLAENEKETYMFAVHVAGNLYKLTSDKTVAINMFNISQEGKAAVLRNEITENELVYTTGIPDSLRRKQAQLAGNISAYDNLVIEEIKKKNPDNKKISLWKNAVFEMKRENERVEDLINRRYPQYNELLQKTDPLTLSEIRKRLTNDETIIDYLLSSRSYEGKRKMYIFLISKEDLKFRETDFDSLFTKNTDIIRNYKMKPISQSETIESFKNYTNALFYMYSNLIQPVEGLIKGKRLIIIPDEEIGLLPFDAFLKYKPVNGQNDFENLSYLINDYTFSFGYSSSLVFGKENKITSANRIYAFSPDYGEENESELPGANSETGTILKLFRGREFSGDNASKSNFIEALNTPAILHLAMHSLTDTSNSKYSYLLFDQDKDSLNVGILYNYEISISKINSPMVVLSACNSGTGKLCSGEGIMSLARGFILAGASSVIRTKWEINDETSSSIIKSFYYYLSKGKPKDEALRLAKLNYIRSNPPAYSNPYFWAAYEVLGDNSPIAGKIHTLLPALTILLFLIIVLMYYFNRRKISSALSL